jgi:hypothetical protein
MNGFQKVVKIKTTPPQDLDLPERSQIQEIISIHRKHFSPSTNAKRRALAHKTVASTLRSIAQWIARNPAICLGYPLSTAFSSIKSAATN